MDWNDYHQAHGIDATRRALTAAVEGNTARKQPPPEPSRFEKALAEKRAAERAANEQVALDNSPLPVARPSLPPRFPVGTLGPLLGPSTQALSEHFQIDPGIAAQCVLTAAFLVVQGKINVECGPVGILAVAEFFLSILESGGRKSATESAAMKPIREYERERFEAYGDALAGYHNAKLTYDQQRSSVVDQYTPKGKAKESMTQEQSEAMKHDLDEIDKTKPQPPAWPNLTVSEPTNEGLYRYFMLSPIAGLINDELFGFLASHTMADSSTMGRLVSTLCQLKDRKPWTRTRYAEGESGALLERRVVVHLMAQPNIAERFLGNSLLDGQGFTARFLICQGVSQAGTRMLADRDRQQRIEDDPRMQQYWDRLEALVRQPLDLDQRTGGVKPKLVSIEGDALEAWVQLHDDIEARLAPGGVYADIQPFASKAPASAARLAAMMAWFETETAPTVEHIARAGKLMGYYLDTVKALTDNAANDQQELQAHRLLVWIEEHGGSLTARDFRCLPRAFRKARDARALLKLLEERRLVRAVTVDSTGRPVSWATTVPEVKS
ncbi:DUF3987 domain-containing protein [Halomonas sp.]|uniref:DUF3987 domain-containing protein n=1 Tax=Halomonas sp. TaxID=1486246 RepID=UPI003D1387B2